MVDPAVRRATASDADELRALEARARAGLEGQRGAARLLQERTAIGEGWVEVLRSGAMAVLVGEIDDVIVGYLTLAGPDAFGAAEVTQVWVEPEARELGFGDEMLSRAIEAARAQGAAVIEATALPGDRETKNLYERAGVTARKIIVSKEL